MGTHSVLLVAGLLALPAGAQNVRSSIQIDAGQTGPSFAPTIASDGDLTAAAWVNGPAPPTSFC